MTRSNDRDPKGSTAAERCVYDASSIVVLDMITAVRKRPGMYLGDPHDGSGQHHMLWEAVGNVIDEHLAGHARRLSVRIDGTTVTVDDDGRGIPPDALASILTEMHGSGSRYGHHPHVHVGTSLRGVGIAAVSATSSELSVEVHHRGERYRIRLEEGRIVEPTTHLGGTRRQGTRLRFTPDPKVLSVVPFDHELIESRLWELSCLNPALDVHLDERRLEGRSGADDLRRRGAEPMVAAKGAHEDVLVEVFLGWRDDSHPPDVRGFVSQYRADEGAHVQGLWQAFADAHPGLSPRVARELHERGLVAWIDVGLYEPRFESPTRSRLGSPEARRAVRRVLGPAVANLVRALGG
ncbi:MAG: ATP-binding protein [Polyangiaceae bacterium]